MPLIQKKASLAFPPHFCYTLTMKTLINPKYRDTLFALIFKEPRNFIQLLNYVTHGRNTLTVNDITLFDLSSDMLKRELINDVSFLTRDGRLLILIEHQSTLNPNMALRLFLYYTELVRLWLEHGKYNIYGTTKLPDIPAPEFYVVYNGHKPLTEPLSTLWQATPTSTNRSAPTNYKVSTCTKPLNKPRPTVKKTAIY